MTVLSLVLGYLIGSIPFALLLPRRVRGLDVRRLGSGNPGATNVWRSAGTALGVSVMALDVAKGSAAVLLASRLDVDGRVMTAAGLASIIGHVFPVWLGFHGGKGVATACGVFAVLAPAATAASVIAFALTTWATRYVSLGSIAAGATLGPAAYFLDGAPVVVAAGGLAGLLVLHRHQQNLVRLRQGTEPRLGARAGAGLL